MANSRGAERLTILTGAALGLALAALSFGIADGALAAPTPARVAYVDPGAGSFILQAAVAMFAGAVVALNAYWARIKKFLGLVPDDSNGDDKSASPPDDA